MTSSIRMGLGIGGEVAFNRVCSACHKPVVQMDPASRAPAEETLRQYPPERILQALTNGKMQVQGTLLTELERRQTSEWLSGRGLGGEAGDAKSMAHRCAADLHPVAAGDWNGWSPTDANARMQSAKAAGLSGADLPKLKLKWAFGIPGGVETSSQPTVVDGTVYIGADTGNVYAIDAKTGCVHWSFLAGSSVRAAPLVARIGQRRVVVIGDMGSHLYALDAGTGEQVWKAQVDDQTLTRITAAPALRDGRLFVVTSSSEEISSLQPQYECCRMRGSASAIDLATGKTIWKFYTIAEASKVVSTDANGRRKWAPGGVGVWDTPTVDARRGLIYFGAGDSFSDPAQPLSDSVIALSMADGKLAWSYQVTANDSYLPFCNKPGPNCPAHLGPDYDISASPILQTMADGRQILVVGDKGGTAIGLDPDKKGAVLWRHHLARVEVGAGGDIVFGGATDANKAYFTLQKTAAVTALDLKTGDTLWFTPTAPPADRAKRTGSAAAVTLIPGAVINGGWDGVLHAFDPADGRLIWSYDTLRAFDTVNGVPAKGGSLGAPGATVAGGMLFVGSGYVGTANGIPGNVLLAFGED